MRTIIKAFTRKEIEEKVARKETEGWRKVIEPKPNPDNVGARLGNPGFVCVMENDAKFPNPRWGHGLL